jgi:hypothetical protein
MTNNQLHNASMLSSGATIASGMWTWVGTNANAIGALIAVASFILTAIFLVLNYQLNKKRLEFDRRHVDELKDIK